MARKKAHSQVFPGLWKQVLHPSRPRKSGENLVPKVMKEYYWDTQPTVVLTGYSTKEHEL
jgi:hypothetical protein